jgi:hypothetical protein
VDAEKLQPQREPTTGLPTIERGGFNLDPDAHDRIVHVTFWGFWDVEVASRFRAALLARARGFGGETWSVLVNARTFLPQTPEVSRHRGETMKMVVNQGCRRIAVIVVKNGTYAMQFTRIAGEAGVANEVFFDTASALKWIRES